MKTIKAMATRTTSQGWGEMHRRADALVPPDIADHIPMRITDEGRSVRFVGSNINLPCFISSHRQYRDLDDLSGCFPTLRKDDMQAVIEYYHSPSGSWIDEYVDLISDAAPLWYEDFKRRWEAGEFPLEAYSRTRTVVDNA